MNFIYQVQALSFFYKNRKIIDSISFDITEGQIIGLIGANGAGKSTLMNLLTGLLTDYEGEILFKGEDIALQPTWMKPQISAVLDKVALYNSMTVQQNITYYSKLLHISKEKGDEIMEEFNLMEYRHFKVAKLSTGYRQRLSLSIALLSNPVIIFLDEPWLGLDPINSKFLSNKITFLSQSQKITFLISGHNLSELDELCSDFMFINQGKIKLFFPKKNQRDFCIVYVNNSSENELKYKNIPHYIDSKNGKLALIDPPTSIADQHMESLMVTIKDLYFNVLAI